jgi:hypothetical protein
MPEAWMQTSDTNDGEFLPLVPRTHGATFDVCVYCGVGGYREQLVDRGSGLLCPACSTREFRRLLGVETLYEAIVRKLEATP